MQPLSNLGADNAATFSQLNAYTDSEALPTGIGAEPADPRALRQSVKWLARSVEEEFIKFKLLSHATAAQQRSNQDFKITFQAKRSRLENLCRAGLDETAPLPSVGRSARSAARLSAAMLTRANAAALSGAAGLVDGALRGTLGALATTAVTPVLLVGAVVHGAAKGARTGNWVGSGKVGSVACAVGLAAAGGVTGSILGLSQIAHLPATVFRHTVHAAARGSIGRKVFRKCDFLAGAQAHVAQKKMSTADIARATRERICMALENVERKIQFPPMALEPDTALITLRSEFTDRYHYHRRS
jgi:hypothetical protein